MSFPPFIPLSHIRKSVTSQFIIYFERFIHHGNLMIVKLYQVSLKKQGIKHFFTCLLITEASVAFSSAAKWSPPS